MNKKLIKPKIGEFKPHTKCYVIFYGDEGMSWTKYIGPGVVLEKNKDKAFGDEPHYLVRIKISGKDDEAYFPEYSLWTLEKLKKVIDEG